MGSIHSKMQMLEVRDEQFPGSGWRSYGAKAKREPVPVSQETAHDKLDNCASTFNGLKH